MALGLSLKDMPRDLVRLFRVGAHTAKHGDRFSFHGRDVTLTKAAGLGVRNALLRGRYETDEVAMIREHLPKHLPVIELGGSCGVVSSFIHSHLLPGTPYIVVEANPDLIEMCRVNARTETICAAIDYRGPTARFRVHPRNSHLGALDNGERGRVIEVPSVTWAPCGLGLALQVHGPW